MGKRGLEWGKYREEDAALVARAPLEVERLAVDLVPVAIEGLERRERADVPADHLKQN